MLKTGSLTCALGILAFTAAAPLPAADIYDTVSVENAAVTEAPAPAANFAGTPAAGAADSVYPLSSPGCCDGYGGQFCMENTCSDGSEFQLRFVPYAWLYAMDGETTVRGLSAPVDISLRDTLNLLEHNVHFIFSGKLEIENDEAGLLVNGFYMNAGFNNQLRRLDFSSTFKMAIVDVVGTYNLLHDSSGGSAMGLSRFDLLAGLRYWQLDGAVRTTGPLGVARGRAGEKEWVDPIIGARAIMPLGEGIEAQVRGDIGGFDWGTASDFTWNIEALLSLQMTENISFRGGYRVLDVKNHRGSGRDEFGFDVQFRGPVSELAIEF